MSPEKRNRLDLFSPSTQQILAVAESYAKGYKHLTIGPQHVFLACFTGVTFAYDFITGMCFGLDYTAYQLMSVYPDRAVGVVQPKLSQSLESIITLAIAESRRLNHTQITTAHVLIAMLIRYETWLRTILKPFGLSNRLLIALLHQSLLTTLRSDDDPRPTDSERERQQLLKRNDTSLVEPAKVEHAIRWLRGAIGLPPLKPRSAFTMIDYLTATINVMPRYPALYTYRANQFIQRKKYLEAALDCSQALNLNAEFAGAYFHRATAYQQIDDQERSLEDYERALRYAPNDWRVGLQRGYIWLKRCEYDKAIDDFNHTLADIPNAPLALAGRASARLSKRDFRWAITDYDQVLRLIPNHPDALHGRGTAKVYQGDFKGAQVDFETMLRFYPQFSYTHSNLGWLALNRGDYAKALQFCQRAIEIDPQNGAAYYSRGAAKAALNDSRGAVTDFKRSLKLWTSVDNLLTAHIGQEMRDFLRQHQTSTPNDTTSEATNDGGQS